VKPISDEKMLITPSKRTEPRIPFGTVVERGLLIPGTVLSDPSGRFTAKVRADGTLISADYRGSIHQVGALVQGAPACNGWTFWHVKLGNSLVAIDVFRQKVRSEMGPALQ
jgi:modification methylase